MIAPRSCRDYDGVMGETTERPKSGTIPVTWVLGFVLLGSLAGGDFAIFYATLFITLVYVAVCLLKGSGS